MEILVAQKIDKPLNLEADLRERRLAGLIPWSGPLLLLLARPMLLIFSQGLVAFILAEVRSRQPWAAAGKWWTVYGTLVDIGCLFGMRHYLRREGFRLRDLLGPVHIKWGRDIWLGLGLYLCIFPFFFAGSMSARGLVLHLFGFDPTPYLMYSHHLPTWATVYSLSLWWLIWSPTEEATYQAYVLPRLRVLTGRGWLAFLVTALCWSAEHAALPLIPDWRFVIFRALAFFPGVILLQFAYLRIRRLAPLVVAHWPMDIVAALITVTPLFFAAR